MWLDHIQELAELLKFDASERFREDVSDHIVSRTILDGNVTLGDGLMDKVEMNVDVLRVSVEFCIL